MVEEWKNVGIWDAKCWWWQNVGEKMEEMDRNFARILERGNKAEILWREHIEEQREDGESTTGEGTAGAREQASNRITARGDANYVGGRKMHRQCYHGLINGK